MDIYTIVLEINPHVEVSLGILEILFPEHNPPPQQHANKLFVVELEGPFQFFSTLPAVLFSKPLSNHGTQSNDLPQALHVNFPTK